MNNYKYLLEDFDLCNTFQKKFNSNFHIFKSSEVQYLTNLLIDKLNKKLLTNKINIDNLNNLHALVEEDQKVYDQNFGVNQFSNDFYEMGDNFRNNYLNLLKKDLRPIIKEDFYFQDNPTVRIHFPHPSSELFYPFFHSDVQLGHPPYEINLWIPLNYPDNLEGYGFTLSDLSKSKEIFKELNFQLEDLKINKKKYTEILTPFSKIQNFDYGNALLFDSRCFHSALPLKNFTRISIDIRIITVSDFEKFNHEYQGLGRKKKFFIPGDGYNELSIDNLPL